MSVSLLIGVTFGILFGLQEGLVAGVLGSIALSMIALVLTWPLGAIGMLGFFALMVLIIVL